ncbi:hypothetical protein [Anabaena sp. AL93]|jgi:hypothetical protein|uniref:hypothetical protein n=1 Tax=Anabaena sp. AL93 TaxID=1678133 RepID=UPI000A68284B|nr:hypothetical protein [Anabaena sp. AL93]
MSIQKLSLLELQQFEDNIPELRGFISRILAETYDDFIKAIYKDIDRIIYLMQENPELYTDNKEDRLTVEIKNQLCCMGYAASHDSKIGGHADLVIRKKEYIWIGEAKIHSSYDYLWEGFQQLNTRYSTGDSNQKDGGLLIYVFVQNTESVMTKWQTHLADQKLIGYTYICCPNRELCFFSTHQHDRTGKLFRVRHMPVILHFNPKDKSAEQRKTKTPIPEKTN